MGKPRSSKEIDRLQNLTRDITAETLKGAQDAGQFKRFPDSALAAADPRFSGITSFLPQGVRSSIPTQYQGMQGQMYANYQTPQKLGEGLTPFGVRPGQSVPVQTGGIGSVSTPLTPPAQDTTTTKGDDDGFTVDQDKVLETINNQREKAGLPPFDTYQDFLSTIDETLANVRLPMGMRMGGGSIDIPRPGGISGLDIMNMQDLNIPSMNFDEASIGVGFADGGIARLSNGGEMDFPRMNGPISGPGTETSDDIPAMLSDGEFVVNAKAVRGVGKLGGANKSKTDQRREGAKMMYALQRAGEKAMRSA